MKNLLFSLIFLVAFNSYSQDVEIGQWRDYLPYNNAISLAKMNGKIYVATENNLFYLDLEDQTLHRLSTINGLSDVGVAAMAKDPQRSTLVVAYNSAKIDIIEDNSIYSMLDVERENIVGEKSINNITFYNDNAYLSCSFGIIELNTRKKEIANTFYLNDNGNLNVNDLCFMGDSIYAATDIGLFKASINDNLLDYQTWQHLIVDFPIARIVVAHQKIYFLGTSLENIYCYSSQNMYVAATAENLKFLKAESNRLFVGAQSSLIEIMPDNTTNTIKESSYLYRVSDVIVDGNIYWLSDGIRGLVRINENLRLKDYKPSGPLTNRAFSTSITQDKILVSPGGVSAQWNNNNTYQGFHWSDGYNWFNIPYMSLGGAKDITNIVESPSGKLYVGTWNNGLLELEYDEDLGNYVLVKEHNYETSNGNLQTISSDTSDGNYGWLRVKDVIIDDNGLVWITNSLVSRGLAFMNNYGQWQSYNITSYNTQNSHLGDLLIDNQGKKWFFIANGGGMIVYDDNGTPENINDDINKHLNTIAGQGNLPSNTVYSLAIDNDGEVWVGTDNGLAVFFNTDEVLSLNGDAQQVLIEADGYVEPIIANESVKAIAIDGANRKWFGTKNSGVFVYSADGSQQIEHFTVKNSPLLSNTINHISIDKNSGEVFISTDKGLISYKGEATEGEKQHGNVLVYPNPVKEDYNGPIAIKNVVEDANIKITDIKGNLIRTTKSFGGQAIWDGKNKYGERANTGVYLVFSTDPTGLETNVAKILFIK
ncbi:hypothetical protein OA183_00095 [Flavobacteriales bacterium]|nr:hypothetical protein [Flavobacteriales bacterium]